MGQSLISIDMGKTTFFTYQPTTSLNILILSPKLTYKPACTFYFFKNIFFKKSFKALLITTILCQSCSKELQMEMYGEINLYDFQHHCGVQECSTYHAILMDRESHLWRKKFTIIIVWQFATKWTHGGIRLCFIN